MKSKLDTPSLITTAEAMKSKLDTPSLITTAEAMKSKLDTTSSLTSNERKADSCPCGAIESRATRFSLVWNPDTGTSTCLHCGKEWTKMSPAGRPAVTIFDPRNPCQGTVAGCKLTRLECNHRYFDWYIDRAAGRAEAAQKRLPVLREIRVVHVRRQPFTLYIGRKCREFRDSKWRNPFSGIDRFKNIRDYEQYVRMSSLMDCLHELDGQTLGCWCHPKACHGDVLKRLREEQLGITDSDVLK